MIKLAQLPVLQRFGGLRENAFHRTTKLSKPIKNIALKTTTKASEAAVKTLLYNLSPKYLRMKVLFQKKSLFNAQIHQKKMRKAKRLNANS